MTTERQKETLRGKQVTLRPMEPGDAESLRAIHSDPEVVRWWGQPDDGFPLNDYPEAHRYVIVYDERSIGMIQYAEEADPDARSADIDIFIGAPYQGKGLGTDAMRTIVRHLQNNVGHHRLTLSTSPENHRAIRSYEKVGFRRVGILERSVRHPLTGEWVDEVLMELVVPPDV